MCGICGIIGEVDPVLLERMMLAQRHRGPDDEGTHVDVQAGVALGHLRLSIIDVAGGRQPIYNEDESLCIVFNGEIYNHQELREGLLARGHRFRTRSDTEVILHLYEEEGERTPERLQGMFAFAVWDRERRSLLLARDRMGIKPLFYAARARRFLFASELKAILADPAIPREVDPVALDRYLTFMYVPAPDTMVRGVHKLLPGHTLLLRSGSARIRRYWQLPPAATSQPKACLRNAARDLREQLSEAVRCRLMSEVPLGAYLSGGLDSSLVVGLTSQVSQAPNTFSVGFEEKAFDESRYARIVAQRFGTRHHELVCRHRATEEIRRIIWHLDEPVADAAAMPTYLMAEATKPHATVVLTGEGADELFAGYSHYKILCLGNALGGTALPQFHFGHPDSSLLSRASAFAGSLSNPCAAYLALKTVFTDAEKAALLRPEVQRPADADPAGRLVEPYLAESAGGDYLQRLLRLDLALWLPDDLLVKVDRMTMAHAVEARVPYLDHRLVESALGLPAGWMLRGGVAKYLLRRMAEGVLPDGIVRRRKTGFGVPVGEWASREWRGLVSGVLGPDAVRRRGWMDPDIVSRLLARPRLGMFHRRQFWTLFSLEMWCRAFLDADPARRP